MSRYLEQSASAFMDMQNQLQQQTRSLFGSFPFPNFNATTGKDSQEPGKGGGSGGDNKA
jgi:polyhydroxyalkanoate synthesis regulator protein